MPKKRSKRIPKGMIAWIEACECESEFETFLKCCGKGCVLTAIQKWCMLEHVTPLFKDLSPDQQEQVFKTIKELYDQDYRPRNSRGKE